MGVYNFYGVDMKETSKSEYETNKKYFDIEIRKLKKHGIFVKTREVPTAYGEPDMVFLLSTSENENFYSVSNICELELIHIVLDNLK